MCDGSAFSPYLPSWEVGAAGLVRSRRVEVRAENMTDRNRGKAPSQRQLKVGETIRHALAEIFARGEIVDEVLNQFSLTVSEVRMTPDLKLATVFVLPLGGEGAEDAVKHLDQAQALLAGRARAGA